MKRLLIIFLLFFIVELSLATFVGMSFFMLGIFLAHLANTSSEFSPVIARFIMGDDRFEKNAEKLLNAGRKLHFRIYWLFSNLCWLALTIMAFTLNNFTLLDAFHKG